MITVLHHDFGNIGSVVRALSHLQIAHVLTRDPGQIEKAEKLIIPGVGSFGAAVRGFAHGDLRALIRHRVLDCQVPVFGFCLGMQLLADYGEEMGTSEGFGLIRGRVVKLRIDGSKYLVPHMGWNDVHQNSLRMFEGVRPDSCFYFVHSYEYVSSDPEVKVATVNYGEINLCAAVEKGNVWGAQFHPEKSQVAGLQLLKNFARF